MDAWRVAPVLRFTDVDEAVTHYRDVLGFVIGDESIHQVPGEGTIYAVARRDGIEVHLGLAREGWAVDPGRPPNALGAYLTVADVDALHVELVDRGADVVEPPQSEPWGHRAMLVRDLAGYLLTFGSAT